MLSNFIHIRKRIDKNITSIESNEIVGNFLLEKEDIAILKELSSNNCVENLVLANGKYISIENLSETQRVEVKLYPFQIKDGSYYENINELIKTSNQRYPQGHFYVFQSDFDSLKSEKTEEINKYFLTTELISFLKSLSDYQKDNELVFFQANHLIINTEYVLADIGDLSSVPNLINHISTSVDKEERQIIFLNELIGTLIKIPEKGERFSYLLKNFADIFSNYKHSHSLYLEKYSFEKLKSEINGQILNYSKKIQSVINDAQSKLIAIPAAFLLIITQFDFSGKNIKLNIALLLSSLIFGTLLELLLRNQFISLSFIKEDIERFKNTFNSNKLIIQGLPFEKSFKNLDKAYKRQDCYLKIIRFLIWIVPISALIIFIISVFNSNLFDLIKTLFAAKK